FYIASEQNGSLDKNPYVPQFYLVGSSGALYTNEYTYSDNVTVPDKYTISDNFNSYQQLVCVPSGLTEFEFPNEHTTEIGSHAFVGSHISALNIPDRIVDIKKWAFRYSEIKTIYLPANANYAEAAFEGSTDKNYPNLLTTIIASSPQAYETLSKLDSRITYEINISYDVDGEIIKTDTVLFGEKFYNFRKDSTTGVYSADAYTLPTESDNWYFGKNDSVEVEITSENLQSFLSGTLEGAAYYSTDSNGIGILHKNITLTNIPTDQAIINKHVEAPTFQANVGTTIYGNQMPEITVIFGYSGFNMNDLFSGFDSYRIKYSISGTKALKNFKGEHRIFHVGEYVVTLEINDVIKDYTFSGTYNEMDIAEGVQKLQYKIILKEREVVLPNDGNDILVTSEKELESAIRLFENNYWYDASYSVVQADGTLRTLGPGEYPQANGSYYVRLTLKDNDGNIKWIYGNQTGIITDNEEEINLLINTDPLVAKPILKGKAAGVRETTISFAGENIPAADLFENYLVKALESTITFNNVEVGYIYNSSETAYIVTVSPTGKYNWAGEESGSEAAKAPITYTIYVNPASVAKPKNKKKTVGTAVVPPFEYEITYENSLFYHVNGYARTQAGPFNQELPMIGGLYYVEIVLNDTVNSAWEDGSTDPVIVTFTLTQTIAVPSINTAAGTEFFTYNAETFRYEDLLNDYADAYSIAIQYKTIAGVTKDVTEVRNAGVYTLTLSLYDGFTWEKSFNGVLGPFTIYQKKVTISGAGEYKESYGSGSAGNRTELADGLGYTITGNLANDNDFGINIIFDVPSDWLVIGSHTIAAKDITVSLLEAVADNYALTNTITDLTFIVEASTIDVHFGDTITHRYDGKAFHPTVSFVDGDNQSLSLVSGTDYTLSYSQYVNGVWESIAGEPIHVGNYKVTVNILNENYIQKDGIILSREFEITKATITVTGYEHNDSTQWIYDGTNSREYNAIYTGGISGDTIEIKVSLTTSSANAGTYASPDVQFIYDTEALKDYTVVKSASGNFSVKISKAGVLVGAVSTLPYKAAPYLESDLNIELVIENEATPDASFSLTYNNSPIGTNLQNANTYTLTIALTDPVNYYFSDAIDDSIEFTFNTNTVTERKTASWTFEITKLGINARVNPEHASVEYNAAEQAAPVVFKLNSAESNWGDLDLAYTLEYYTEATLKNKIEGKPINAGTYYVKFALAAPDSDNYVLVLLNQSANRKFEITPKNLEVSSKEYQQSYNASDSFSGLTGLTITNLPAVDTTTAGTLKVDITTQNSKVGTYSTADETATIVFSGYNENNYTVSLAENAYIQMKIIPVSASVSWSFLGSEISSGHSIVYNGNDQTDDLAATYQTISGTVNQLNITITGQGTNLRNAGTYTLTASFESGLSDSTNNYTLSNNSITFVITAKTILKADIDALTWMNVAASNRTLITGTFKVDETDVTATNAFAKYRSGTANKIELRVPTTMPYNGIAKPISYQGNLQEELGAYTATATLTLASTNYAWDTELNPNAAGEVTITKDWYVVEFTNELKTDFSTDGWIYGSSPEYVMPEPGFEGVTLTYKLSNGEGILIEDISDLAEWLNAAMPVGSWTLTVCIPEYVDMIGSTTVTYDASDVDFIFAVTPASITLANATAINNQTFTHVYNGLPHYIKNVVPDIQLVEPTRENTGWADTQYNSSYSNASTLELTY
ncbi:MAG: leucine-rich repeat domain-containing protein, partial [Anaeroplasmataceae bacterium]|nr:leucine-rich repeat domain-containing protein [Anaeroplasmataceae bacterium]